MARIVRIAWLSAASIAAGLALVCASPPAGAQFINPFEALFGSPPRPPGSVPGSRQPAGPPPQQQAYPQYPDQRSQDPRYQDPRYRDPAYQDPRYPEQTNIPRPGAVQGQPLPPPPGATAAVPDARPTRTAPADAPPPPSDDTVTELPSQKIPNKSAMFSGLDKITGRIINFDAAVGETVQFGALQVTPRVCFTRPPTESANTDAFIEVDEVTLQGEIKRIFSGWMFASSPGLHAVEHPIYDVWLTDCKNPAVAVAAPVEVSTSAPPPPKPPAAAAPAQRRPAQQPGNQPRR